MLLSLDIQEKMMGSKLLFQGLSLTINEGEKVAAIGRNGVGKTTLFGLISGADHDFHGSVEIKKGVRVVVTAQEHFASEHLSAVEYVLQTVPRYAELQEVIETYPETMGDDMAKITAYSDALAEFGEREYYDIEERILAALADFELSREQAAGPIGSLSGGQKRFVELVKVRFAEADLVLLDEPTNHMDYWGKDRFLEWLRETKQAVFVISHDRDVLKEVTKILEIKDKKVQVFPGNYDAYLRQNSTSTLTQISSYEESLKQLEKLRKQILQAAARKAGAGNNAPKILEERLRREYKALKDQLEKPSFWIDQDSVSQMKDKVVDSYHKYKDKNIRIAQEQIDEYTTSLLTVRDLSVGYAAPLFDKASFQLRHGDRLLVRGRNGAGKSTLIRTLIEKVTGEPAGTTVFGGSIEVSPKLRLGVYEQELSARYLPLTLGEAVAQAYHENGLLLTEENLNKLLAGYLFDPTNDRKLPIERLSGGQKARFQLITMFCTKPNLLILDEPTNHLDLPSIEELEKALLAYEGAILYVSHDSYFLEKMGGETLAVGRQ